MGVVIQFFGMNPVIKVTTTITSLKINRISHFINSFYTKITKVIKNYKKS